MTLERIGFERSKLEFCQWQYTETRCSFGLPPDGNHLIWSEQICSRFTARTAEIRASRLLGKLMLDGLVRGRSQNGQRDSTDPRGSNLRPVASKDSAEASAFGQQALECLRLELGRKAVVTRASDDVR